MFDVELMLLVATGFGLGLAHALDSDHVIAVSTILCNSPSLRKSIVSATAWGTGHSAALLIVGLLVLAFRVVIPESIMSLLELPAGVALIILGIFLIRSLVKNNASAHQHTHPHIHLDGNGKSYVHTHAHLHKSAFTGILQGLGGSAAVMLVTLATVPSAELGFVFILIFGVGVILGMVSIACLISSLLTLTASRLKKVHEKIVAVTGLISIGFGVFIIVQVVLQYTS